MDSLLAALGVGTNDVIAAFLGSVCGAFLLRSADPRAVIGTVFVGTVFGMYFGPNAMMVLGKQPNNLLTLIVGSTGMGGLTIAASWVQRKFFDGGDTK